MEIHVYVYLTSPFRLRIIWRRMKNCLLVIWERAVMFVDITNFIGMVPCWKLKVVQPILQRKIRTVEVFECEPVHW
jgi:hypothetical protein